MGGCWHSNEVRRSAVGKYQKTCKDLLWANIRRCANIFGRISADVQRSFLQISAEVRVPAVGKYRKNVQRSLGKYQWKCKDHEYLLANISKKYQLERTAVTRRECDAS